MRPRHRSVLVAVLLAALLGGCGSDGDESAERPPPARPEDFPRAAGRTLAELRGSLEAGPVLAPSGSLLEPGANRFGFGLFDRERAQVADVPAVVYIASSADGRALGPFVARYESLEVKAPFQSEGVKDDPDAAKSVYVADVEFPRPGSYDVISVARFDDRLVATDPVRVQVVRDGPVPDPGEPAIRVHTPTEASAGGDLASIDTRRPHGTMHEDDLADVLGEKPVVLLFATPALCQSRVCGPVVDVAEQVKAEHGDEAAWIHMEIYNGNEIERGFRSQVLDWKLPTEPWLFTIDREGNVAARIEGAFSVRELEQALAKATRG